MHTKFMLNVLNNIQNFKIVLLEHFVSLEMSDLKDFERIKVSKFTML